MQSFTVHNLLRDKHYLTFNMHVGESETAGSSMLTTAVNMAGTLHIDTIMYMYLVLG